MNRDDEPTRSLSGTPPDSGAVWAAEDEIEGFRRIRKIGEGGMGEVWLAEQLQPRRQVALKLVRRGFLSSQLLSRFELERQVLGRMAHPNVARLYGAGQTRRGQPYFVMEHVEGEPITRYADDRGLCVRERLTLFGEVCAGVHHAHQKGITHRDLKPSNVLVATADEERTPKIIDFGVAKASDLVGDPTTSPAPHTRVGQVVGTPEYMAPEQADPEAIDIDTRADVYSLGVLLYELLAGVRPFDSRGAVGTPLQLQQAILNTDPRPPSARVTQPDEGSRERALRRGRPAPELARELRGDLDWITLKALERDRERRYASVAEMAADVERHLTDQPVLARPPSSRDRLVKLYRRHRAATIASGVTAVGLVVALMVATAGLVRARRAERLAQNEAETSRRVTELLVELFDNVDPSRSRGREITVREVLDSGVDRVDARLAAQPRVRASLLETMGRVYTSLGLYDQAAPLLEQAVALRSERSQDPLAVASALGLLAIARGWQGDHETSHSLAVRALELRRRELGSDHPLVADSLNTLGNALQNLGRGEEARDAHRRALELRERGDPDAGESDPGDLAQSAHNLAISQLSLGETESAEELLRRAIAWEAAVDPEGNHDLATSLHVLAIVLEDQERYGEAIATEERALAIRERVLGAEHPHTSFSLTTLANLYRANGNATAAEPLLRRAIEIGRASWGPLYPEVRWMRRSLAQALADQGREAEAEAVLVSLRDETSTAGEDAALTPTLNALGSLYLEQGRLGDAEEALERSIEIEERVSGGGHPYLLEPLLGLVAVRVAQGDEASKAVLCGRALEIEGSSEAVEPGVAGRLDELCVDG